ncbi:hypothetical protein CMQ_3934 [Grosmannia clavigera kw1407]|uniref:Uncharacterized protein n=1 Tax=Grosmannia clavigera (strain kw1407 / UAMH 11150) TaxID=655863 RepID=F0X8N6_GROCL|nr:uncharacterized protein CMQ_3934 [Grosmannia clavigera kw1407]EFX05865.1 hypothetical protein CMQ_3934 [Grosmannia clavigera kw1407]
MHVLRKGQYWRSDIALAIKPPLVSLWDRLLVANHQADRLHALTEEASQALALPERDALGTRLLRHTVVEEGRNQTRGWRAGLLASRYAATASLTGMAMHTKHIPDTVTPGRLFPDEVDWTRAMPRVFDCRLAGWEMWPSQLMEVSLALHTKRRTK